MDMIFQADGMDALAVKQVMSFAKKHALEHGPIILELDTYRWVGLINILFQPNGCIFFPVQRVSSYQANVGYS